jgi:hypothetical protein
MMPRSGVVGLLPFDVRQKLISNGWGVLPIRIHDGAGKSAGKAPSIRGWQLFAQFGAKLPTVADLKDWGRSTLKAPGTGIATGNVIAIDLDLSDAVTLNEVKAIAFDVFGTTPFVRQGRAPRVALIYRAAEAIGSVLRKVLHGTGDGLDVLAIGKQFIAYGIHPLTCRCYEWIGSEQPLTSSPGAAPSITAAEVTCFLERVGKILPLSKTGGRRGTRSGKVGEGAEIVRNAEGLVTDGREGWLRDKVWQAAHELQAAHSKLSIKGLTDRAWEIFSNTAHLEDGRWTRRDAEVKARELIDRIERKLVTLAPTLQQTQPTYPDERLSLREAESAVTAHIRSFFGQHVPAWLGEVANHQLALKASNDNGRLHSEGPVPLHWALRIETGIGKTREAVRCAATAAKAGMEILYFVPRLNLGDELVPLFAEESVSARVYRGRDAPDPEKPERAMCLEPASVQDALKACASSVFQAVCELELKKQATLLRCPSFLGCSHVKQRWATPQVWILTHALLFQARPDFIASPAALVIDEQFLGSAIPDSANKLTLDAIQHAGLIYHDDGSRLVEPSRTLEQGRAVLVRALREHPDGPLLSEPLMGAGVTGDLAREMHALESSRKQEPGIYPGMLAHRRSKAAEAAGSVNREVLALASFWNELAEFLDGASAESGRLRLVYDRETQARTIERRSLRRVHGTWRAPALILNATAPEATLLEPVIGGPVELKASISALWSPHGRIRQIIGAPVSASKLGIVSGKDDGKPVKRIIMDLRRWIGLRAATAWPGLVAVVGQKALIEKLKATALPANVEVGHFGALTGLDRWKTARVLICIGRPLPGPELMERNAGVILGVPVVPVKAVDGFAWYDRSAGGIRLQDGSAVRVVCDRHPDPVAEALRWQACDAEVIQAIGRLRPLRREADNSYFVDIVCDVPLPLTVDAVETWDAALPGRWALMADDGVILQSPSDIMAAWPSWGLSRDQARAMSDPTMGETSIRNLFIDVCPIVNRFTYKPAGRNSQTSSALVLPNGPDRFKDWLEERLGDIDWVRREGPAEPACPANDNEEGLRKAA